MPPAGIPHINQETDTRARSSNGHDPQRDPRANLSDGLKRSIVNRRRQAAHQHHPAPSAPATPGRTTTPATRTPQPAPNYVLGIAGEAAHPLLTGNTHLSWARGSG